MRRRVAARITIYTNGDTKVVGTPKQDEQYRKQMARSMLQVISFLIGPACIGSTVCYSDGPKLDYPPPNRKSLRIEYGEQDAVANERVLGQAERHDHQGERPPLPAKADTGKQEQA